MLMDEEEIRTRNGSAELPAGSVIKSDRLFALAGLGAGDAARATPRQTSSAGAQRAHFEQLAAQEVGIFHSNRMKRSREVKESQQAQVNKVEAVASAKLLVEARLKGLIAGAPSPARDRATTAATGAATGAASEVPWGHTTDGGAVGKRARLAGGVPFVPASSSATGGYSPGGAVPPGPATTSATASTAPAAATETSARASSTREAGPGCAAGVSAIATMQAAARQSLGQAPQPPMPLPPPPPPRRSE